MVELSAELARQTRVFRVAAAWRLPWLQQSTSSTSIFCSSARLERLAFLRSPPKKSGDLATDHSVICVLCSSSVRLAQCVGPSSPSAVVTNP